MWFVVLCLAFLTSYIAKNKGRSALGWFFVGLLVPIIGLIASLVVKKNQTVLEQKAISSGGFKRCEHCAELIKSAAKVCKHCGNEISHRPKIRRDLSDVDLSFSKIDDAGKVCRKCSVPLKNGHVRCHICKAMND